MPCFKIGRKGGDPGHIIAPGHRTECACDRSAHSACNTSADHGSFQTQVHAINGRLRNTKKPCNGRRSGNSLHFFILCFQEHTKGCACLGKYGCCLKAGKSIISQCGIISHRNGCDSPMYAEYNQYLPKAAHNNTRHNRAQSIQKIINITDSTADCITHGSEGQQGKRHHDGNGKHRCEQIPHYQGQILFKETFHIRSNPDCQNNGNNGRSIA